MSTDVQSCKSPHVPSYHKRLCGEYTKHGHECTFFGVDNYSPSRLVCYGSRWRYGDNLLPDDIPGPRRSQQKHYRTKLDPRVTFARSPSELSFYGLRLLTRFSLAPQIPEFVPAVLAPEFEEVIGQVARSGGFYHMTFQVYEGRQVDCEIWCQDKETVEEPASFAFMFEDMSQFLLFVQRLR